MNVSQQTIDTPLGALTIRAVGLDPSGYSVALSRPEIALPRGMSVDGIVAAMIQIAPTKSASKVRCECLWGQIPASGRPESGECLDAQSWDHKDQRVTMGTEDYDTLSGRLPNLGFTGDNYPVTYLENGLAVEIPNAPKGSDFSLHFVVAWRALPDPADCSTWYAVDIPHLKLEKANKTVQVTSLRSAPDL